MTAAAALISLPFAGLLLRGFRPAEAWLFGGIALAALLWKLRRRLSARPLLVWAPWLAWAALSALFSGQPLSALAPLSRWLAALAVVAAVPQFADDDLRRCWRLALFVAAPIVAVSALTTGLAELMAHGSGEAMTGLLPPYYNYSAFVLAAAGAASLSSISSGFLAVVCFTVLLVARARAALLALLAGSAIWLLRDAGRKKLIAAGAGLAVIAALALATGGLARLAKRDKSYAAKRPQIWRAAIEIAADSPFFGEGPGRFEAGFRRHMFPAGYGLARYRFSSAYAHSEPLQILAETGIAGTLLFACGLAGTLTAGWAIGPAATAAMAAAAAMGTQCLADNMLQMPALALLLASALGLALKQGPKRHASVDQAVWGAAAVLLAALTSGALWVDLRARTLADESGPAGHRLEVAQKRLKLFPREPYAWEAVARAKVELGDRDGALAAFTEAARLAPFNAVNETARGELLRAAGRLPEAEGAARRALGLEPDALQARLLLAELLESSGRKRQAKNEAEELARRSARVSPLDLENRSSIYTGYDRAMASFDRPRFEALRGRFGLLPRRFE